MVLRYLFGTGSETTPASNSSEKSPLAKENTNNGQPIAILDKNEHSSQINQSAQNNQRPEISPSKDSSLQTVINAENTPSSTITENIKSTAPGKAEPLTKSNETMSPFSQGEDEEDFFVIKKETYESVKQQYEAKLQTVQQTLEKTEKTLQIAQQNLQTTENNLKIEQQKTVDAANASKALEQKLTGLTQQNTSLQEAHQKTKSQVETLQTQVRTLQDNEEFSKKRNAALNHFATQLNEKLEKKETELDQSNEALKQKNEELVELQFSRTIIQNSYQQEVTGLKHELTTLQQTLTTLQTELTTLRNKNNQLQANVHSEKHEAKQRETETQAEIDHLEAELSKANEALCTLKKAHHEQSMLAEQKFNEANATNITLKETVQTLHMKLAQGRKEFFDEKQGLQEKLKTSQNTINEMQLSLAQTKRQHITATQEKANLNTELSNIKQQLATANQEQAKLKTELSNTKQQLATANQQTANLKAELSGTKQLLTSTTPEIDKLKSELSKIQKLLEAANEENSSFQSSIEYNQKINQGLRQQLIVLRDENVQQKKQIEQQSHAIQQLKQRPTSFSSVVQLSGSKKLSESNMFTEKTSQNAPNSKTAIATHAIRAKH